MKKTFLFIFIYFLFFPKFVFAGNVPPGGDCTNSLDCQNGYICQLVTGDKICVRKNLAPAQITIGGLSAPPTANISINVTIINVINFLIGSGSVIFLLVFMWGSVMWLTSSGEKMALEKARNTLTYGALGFVLLISTFAIFQIVRTLLLNGI